MAKIKLKTEIEVEMDIQFPVYKQYGGFAKIISDTEYIKADEYGITHYRNMPDSTANIIILGRDSTESEFMEALSIQLDKFTNILSLHTQKCFLEASVQATEEEIIRYHYEQSPREIFSRNSELCDAINNDFGYLNDLDKVINEQNNY